jgi:hypothetical protein
MSDEAIAFLPEGGRLELVEAPPTPPPSEGEVVVKTRFVGFCGTDREIVQGGIAVHPGDGMLILGHEMLGEVTQTGAGADSFAPGDRVVTLVRLPCDQCAPCKAGESGIGRNPSEDLGDIAHRLDLSEDQLAVAALQVESGADLPHRNARIDCELDETGGFGTHFGQLVLSEIGSSNTKPSSRYEESCRSSRVRTRIGRDANKPPWRPDSQPPLLAATL